MVTATFGRLSADPVTDQHGRFAGWVRYRVQPEHVQHAVCTLPPEVTAKPAANDQRYA
jgi:hypothetical protein